MLHGVLGQPPVLLLGDVEQGDERGAGNRVEGDGLSGALNVVGGKPRHYLSTSPMIGSTEEMTATASATRPPLSMIGSVWRLANEGARMCRR